MIFAVQFKGGSLQVVISLINEFKKFDDNEYHVIMSENVETQLSLQDFPENFHFYKFPYTGFIRLSTIIKRKKWFDEIEYQIKPDCTITTSGPLYWRSKAPMLMGYNLPANIYLDSPFFRIIPLKKKLKWWYKKVGQRIFFKREADAFFVQTDDVNERLKKYVRNDNVYTISNTFNNFYLNPIKFPNKLPERQNGEIRMLTISTFYPHKNFDIIEPVLNELDRRNMNNIKFVTTLDELNYNRIFDDKYIDKVVNLGAVKSIECASLYDECDYMFLPTLLECFSASYAEAMIMGKPILTSNLSFAHTVCHDAAVYFNPMDAKDIADKIETVIKTPELQNDLIQKGKVQSNQFGTAEDRARQVLNLCQKIAK